MFSHGYLKSSCRLQLEYSITPTGEEEEEAISRGTITDSCPHPYDSCQGQNDDLNLGAPHAAEDTPVKSQDGKLGEAKRRRIEHLDDEDVQPHVTRDVTGGPGDVLDMEAESIMGPFWKNRASH